MEDTAIVPVVVVPCGVELAGDGCPCIGNVSGDGFVTTLDRNMLYGKLGQYGAQWTGILQDKYKIPLGHALYSLCGDMNFDGFNTTLDRNMLYGKLGQYGALWTGDPESPDKYKIPCE
jgi:hypothetical protein